MTDLAKLSLLELVAVRDRAADVQAELCRRDEAAKAGADKLALWPELLRQLDRASDLLSVCDLDAPSDVADMADIRQTLARARELR
jgi:hypothetical protein